MSDKKARLINMVRNGGSISSRAEKQKRTKIGDYLKFEEETLSIRESTLHELQNSLSMYGSIILDLEASIKRNVAEIRVLLNQSKNLLGKLRFSDSKKEVTRYAMTIGFNKGQVEILKTENSVSQVEIENYGRMRSSIRVDVERTTSEISKLRASIEAKKKLLEEDSA